MTAAIKIENVNKFFGAVHALKDINLEVFEGETLALVGENGAGKSTLMKILTGAYQKDSGEIFIGGQRANLSSTMRAKRLGIGQVYQRFELIPELSVAENILLGEAGYSSRGLINKKRMCAEVQGYLEKYGIPVQPEQKVGTLSSALCQLVAIIKVLHRNPKIIIMDEPTAVLSIKEVQVLFRIIEELKQQKKTLIYISHRLEEIFQICDRVAVMRDGMMVATMENENLTREMLFQHMLGRSLDDDKKIRKRGSGGKVILELEHVTTSRVTDISFALHEGEILGMAGLVNSGRTETARAIYGIDKLKSGCIKLDGKPLRIRRPKDAYDAGIFLAPEDRRKEAMVLCRSIRENVSLAKLDGISSHKILQLKRESEQVGKLCSQLNVRMDTIESPVQTLSGGNQQKIVVAKALTAMPRILIFDEPTQGIDVGAKAEIYDLMEQLRDDGMSIIVISSEIEELQKVCDRAVVLHEGHLTGEISASELDDSEKILDYMYRSVHDDEDSKQ